MINSNWGWFATVLGLGFPHYSQSYGIILLWTSNFRQTLTHIHIFYGKSQRRNSRPHHRSDRPSHRTLLLWTSAGQFWMASVWRPAIFVLWLAYISIQTTSHTYNHLYIYIYTYMYGQQAEDWVVPMYHSNVLLSRQGTPVQSPGRKAKHSHRTRAPRGFWALFDLGGTYSPPPAII